MNRYGLRAGLAVLTVSLAGCGGTLLEPDRVEYKAAAKLPSLEIPPDLTSPKREERYQVPDISPAGTATYSGYSAERTGAPRSATTQLLPDVAKAKLERSGNERWLVVSEPPEKVWPIVKEFWQENGFLINIEIPEAGVMETDWAENRAKIPQDFIRNALGKLFEGAFSTPERDKYRTRLERGPQPGSTEIYISHRGVVEVYTSQRQDTTVWQPRPADPGLEAEFLRRLMVRFGVADSSARAQLAAPEPKPEHARIVNSQDGAGTLELAEPFDRAWRRVGLVLDRVGFTVEDRDRSKGFYFVRYIDSEIDAKKDEGFLSSLAFWRPGKPAAKPEQYRVLVKDRNDSSEVQVLTKDGAVDRSDTARKILSLLHDQLK
ncbi:MAG: outer membrane protein assembly factor BamC [Burkholderiales bacterium]